MHRICLTIWIVLALIMAFDNDYRIEQLEKQIQNIRVEQDFQLDEITLLQAWRPC
jgi:hypothetical protein